MIVDRLREAFRNDRGRLRLEAMEMLGRMGSALLGTEMVTELKACLDDADDGVRRATVVALGTSRRGTRMPRSRRPSSAA